jgi:signal transduction histidine kinase
MKSSVHQIRLRLLSLLGSAFVSVLLILILLFPPVTAYVLTNLPEASNLRFPILGYIEGYYLGNGGWDGVGEVLQFYDDFPPEYTILLDKDNRIILDSGSASASTVGSIYEMSGHDIALSLIANGERIGALLVKPLPLIWRGRLASGIILPIAGISLVLGLFVFLIAFLLIRRFINPLADVMYAARAVADGKLETRMATEGPQDLRRLAESFNEMATSLERSDRERRDMLADVAHELRTPLSVIRGRLEGIVDGVYPETDTPVSTALEQTYLLERLVDDLRLLTLAESRQLHFEFKPVDLGNLAAHVTDLFQAEAREKNISLTLGRSSENLTATADAQRTEQVIANLVSNALRYVPEGGRVWIEITADETAVNLSVNDDGKGIPEADLPFIFDRFWRKDKSRSRISGGTGLGLAIAKQLIEAQGGEITAQNLPEGGLQVRLLFEK